MKIGIVAPLSIAAVHGGVRTQAIKTAEGLKELGYTVGFVSPWDNSFQYDLVHVFSAGPETSGIGAILSKRKIPFVLSPVFFSNRSARIIAASLKIERSLDRIGSGIHSDFGIKAELCKSADLLLPNTSQEAHLIQNGLGIEDSRIKVVPNGVEDHFSEADPALFTETYHLTDFILCAAQASAPRKNVQLLIRSADELKRPVVVIGTFDESTYSKECQKLADEMDNVHLIGHIDHDNPLLSSAYAACNTFVLPSWYETPGIAAMEAALAGASVVITEVGGTKEYFGDMVSYIDPHDSSTFIRVLNESVEKPVDPALKQHILANYTWDKIARKTAEAYKSVLS